MKKEMLLTGCIIISFVLSGCLVRYDHALLKSGKPNVTYYKDGYLAVSAAAKGSGTNSGSPWALRFTGSGSPNGRIKVMNIRVEIEDEIINHPDMVIELKGRGWGQKLTDYFIPEFDNVESSVYLSYDIVSTDLDETLKIKHTFRLERMKGKVLSNPILDYT